MSNKPFPSAGADVWYSYALAELGQAQFEPEDREELAIHYKGMVFGFGFMQGFTVAQISNDIKLAIKNATPINPRFLAGLRAVLAEGAMPL